jgi:ubiquinone/menaquinone biosynthesis C-methylase UbiE
MEKIVKSGLDNEKASPEFDQYAASYSKLLDDPARNRFASDPLHFHRRKLTVIKKLLQDAGISLKSQRWLDVGCGGGELLGLGGNEFGEAIGCDPASRMLSTNSSAKMFQQPSAVDLPFPDSSVDFVTAVCVYHHVHGDARSLLTHEIRRVLTPGGLCCVIEHNPWNPVTRQIVKRCAVDIDAELLTARFTRSMFEASGFISPTIQYFLYLPEKYYKTFGAQEKLLSKFPFGGQYAVLARKPSETAKP